MNPCVILIVTFLAAGIERAWLQVSLVRDFAKRSIGLLEKETSIICSFHANLANYGIVNYLDDQVG